MPNKPYRKSIKVTFSVSPVLCQQMQVFAKNLGVSDSEAFRILIVQGLERVNLPNHPLKFAVFKGSSVDSSESTEEST